MGIVMHFIFQLFTGDGEFYLYHIKQYGAIKVVRMVQMKHGLMHHVS